jgi:two-component system KDP operon response regulator KdpE
MARILVINDQPLIRDIFREALEHNGHHVTVAADGYEGVRSCHDAHPDLVVDLQMPRLDGFETIRQLRTMGDVPIIAMSGGGESDEGSNLLEIARHLGAVRTFQKSIRLNDLVTLVRDVLSQFGAR